MRSIPVCIVILLMHSGLFGQFPLTRTLEIRYGQQRPAITCMAQDHMGLLWLGTDLGVLRTDGERVEPILRVDRGGVNALHSSGEDVFVALGSGAVLRCHASGCDTLIHPGDLAVRDMLADQQGRLWLATYGEGIWIVEGDAISVIGLEHGLRDEHVNALALRTDGTVVAATDQGLAIMDGGSVVRLLGEAEGAPDNLILCVTTTTSGVIWAGTNKSGAFRWDPNGDGPPEPLDQSWTEGEIQRIAVQGDMVWLATTEAGVIVHDLSGPTARYKHDPDATKIEGVFDLLADHDGMVWWCSGNDVLNRSDAAILFIEHHEGHDLRKASAVCTDPSGRIWFALSNTLHHHPAGFSDEHVMGSIPVRTGPQTPIVSLAASNDGWIWAGTFGDGVISVPPDGVPRYFREGVNENVLSVKVRGNEVWFATLQGLAQYDPDQGMRSFPLPFPGFLFDVLPLADGSVLAATDGNGILLLDVTRREWDTITRSEGTFYSVVADGDGRAWAAGPGTGFCPIGQRDTACVGGDRSPFDEELFALAFFKEHLIAFGSTGVLAYHPATGVLTDMTARLGMAGVHAELNAIWNDGKGSLWLASDHGLVRMRPTEWHFSDRPRMVITSIMEGATVLDAGDDIILPHDHGRLQIRFTGIHYVDPGSVRFEYHLEGPDERRQITRDREVIFSDLSPGDHVFRVRAFTGEAPSEEEWSTIRFTIRPPIWARAWFILLSLAVAITFFVLLLRARDKRLRERERIEREKVRFQLDALRSQVDPHFLFNSFNTLVELIETDADIAVAHVEKLSLFFRNILQVRDKELITVDEELGLLANYFALEQHRFGEAISMEVNVSDDAREKYIVPLTLQLLVENAIKHNIATIQRPLQISVASTEEDIVVTNPVQERLTAPRSMGFGLDSIRKRYKALTERPIRMERTEERFTVAIPLITHAP